MEKIQFLSEQVGPVEDLFKRKVSLILLGKKKTLAYLTNIRYANEMQDRVALCLYGSIDDGCIVSIENVFREIFSPTTSLDILILNENQKSELGKVCLPFFESS